METAFVVCAESGVIDQSTQNLSINNILQDISAPNFPIAVPMSAIAYLIRKRSEKDPVEIRIIITLTGQSKPLADIPIAVSFEGKLATRIVARMQVMVIPAPGLLKVAFVYRKKELGAWTINVAQIAGPPSTTITPTNDVQKTKSRGLKKRAKTV